MARLGLGFVLGLGLGLGRVSLFDKADRRKICKRDGMICDENSID